MINPDIEQILEVTPQLSFIERARLMDVLWRIEAYEKRECVLSSLAETVNAVRNNRKYEDSRILRTAIEQMERAIVDLKKSLE